VQCKVLYSTIKEHRFGLLEENHYVHENCMDITMGSNMMLLCFPLFLNISNIRENVNLSVHNCENPGRENYLMYMVVTFKDKT